MWSMALIPLLAFFVLIVAGIYLDKLGAVRVLVFAASLIAALALCAFLDLPWAVLIVVEVVLDITLILMILGEDIPVL